MAIPARFGAWLVRERLRRRLTQRQLAQLIQSHPAQITRWENGERLPELMFFRAIVLAFRVNANEVLSKHVCAEDDVRARASRRARSRKSSARDAAA
jgi:transcriptional regulator with XRE-family HTH domain